MDKNFRKKEQIKEEIKTLEVKKTKNQQRIEKLNAECKDLKLRLIDSNNQIELIKLEKNVVKDLKKSSKSFLKKYKRYFISSITILFFIGNILVNKELNPLIIQESLATAVFIFTSSCIGCSVFNLIRDKITIKNFPLAKENLKEYEKQHEELEKNLYIKNTLLNGKIEELKDIDSKLDSKEKELCELKRMQEKKDLARINNLTNYLFNLPEQNHSIYNNDYYLNNVENINSNYLAPKEVEQPYVRNLNINNKNKSNL